MTDPKLVQAILHKVAYDLSIDNSYFEIDGKRYGATEVQAQAAAIEQPVVEAVKWDATDFAKNQPFEKLCRERDADKRDAALWRKHQASPPSLSAAQLSALTRTEEWVKEHGREGSDLAVVCDALRALARMGAA